MSDECVHDYAVAERVRTETVNPLAGTAITRATISDTITKLYCMMCGKVLIIGKESSK